MYNGNRRNKAANAGAITNSADISFISDDKLVTADNIVNNGTLTQARRDILVGMLSSSLVRECLARENIRETVKWHKRKGVVGECMRGVAGEQKGWQKKGSQEVHNVSYLTRAW